LYGQQRNPPQKWIYVYKELHSKKILGCFNPNLGQIWANPNVGLKISLKIIQLKVEILNYIFNTTIFWGLSIFDQSLG